jgi:hypothetical protein
MLIFGEFNVFHPADARRIVHKAYAALKPGGKLLLEPHTFTAVQQVGEASASWYTQKSGLFPHLVLQENFWNAERRAATERYYVIDAVTGVVTRHSSSMQAYNEADYRSLLKASGFVNVTFYPSLAGDSAINSALVCCVARQ